MSTEARERKRLYSYTAYGLHIQAALPLPELTPTKGGAPHISILFRELSPAPFELPDEGGLVLNTPEGAYFYFRRLGTFLARGGREILIDPLPGVAMRAFQLPLLGAVLGVLLHQRGLFTLHASTVAIDGAAVAFIGARQAGKSTTAAALHAQGHALITDDILALDLAKDTNGIVQALPGFSLLKLWPASVTALGGDPDMLPVVHPQLEKRMLDPQTGFQDTPLPLKRIYVLGEGPQLSSTDLSAREAFVELLSHSYAARFLGEAAAGPDHFQQCTRLVQQVPVCRLERPSDLSQLSALVQFIEDDCYNISNRM